MKPFLSEVPATKRCHAFTLIELAVVLGLLALWGGAAGSGPGPQRRHQPNLGLHSDLTLPGPSQTWVLIEEHPDSINDAALLMRMPAVGSWPAAVPWEDVPAAHHNGAVCLSFADGHVEVHQWLDAATKSPIQKIGGSSATGLVSPQDNRWLVQRSSAPR